MGRGKRHALSFSFSPASPPPQHKEASGEERGLIQTLTSLCSLRPDFGRNTDWLLEQCHKIWLAVGITRSWKYLFLAWLFLWIICRRQREGSILLSFLLFYGLMIEKYALVVPWKFRKNRWQRWIPLQVADHEQGAFWFTNKWVQIKILSIVKLVSFESLAGNDFSGRGTQAEAHCERNLNCQLWSIRQKVLHCCSRNFCRLYHKS